VGGAARRWRWWWQGVCVEMMCACWGHWLANRPTRRHGRQAGPPHLHTAAAAPVAVPAAPAHALTVVASPNALFPSALSTPCAGLTCPAPAGHKNAVLEVHWTPDGDRLISCSPDKTVRCWDAETGGQLKKMNEHKDIVNSCCPLRRGPPLVVSGGDDCAAKLWDLRAKRSVKTFNERYQVGGKAGGSGPAAGWGAAGYPLTRTPWRSVPGRRLLTACFCASCCPPSSSACRY
jgi:hypothetical protein